MATQYVPWVTDFAAQHQHVYSPWISDFGRNPVSSPPPASVEPLAGHTTAAAGMDWGAVALGGAMGIAFALLLVAAFLVLRARLRPGARATA
jgi:hypothetical protein